MNENLEIEYKMLVSEQEFNQLRDLTGVDQVLVQRVLRLHAQLDIKAHRNADPRRPGKTLVHNEDSSGRGRAGNGDGAAGKQSGSVG